LLKSNFPMINSVLGRILLFIWWLVPATAWSQGHLLLVGGNSETEGGWSDAPYGWAAAQAPNHRVAIIGVSSASQWLPDYFQALGASSARNFQVSSRAQADATALVDSLAGYDCIFFRGGDQWDYLSIYQGTRLDSVVVATYARGGVIGGTSAGLAVLSGVDFTAENGTVYPEEMLADWDNPFAQLSDSFLPLLPGYLFDSHFVERGRFARLAGLMARWQLTQGQRIHGIGVDDKTALCIAPDGQTLAYGTGAVNFYFDDQSAQGFLSSGSKPTIDALRLVQLLDGDSLHLLSGAIGGFSTNSQPRYLTETNPYTLLMSGSDRLSDQAEMLDHLVQATGQPQDSLLILSAQATGLAADLSTMLQAMSGVGVVSVLTTDADQQASAVADVIQTASKFVLAGNVPADLQAFLIGGSNGQQLDQRLRAQGSIMALVGDDARLAGRTLVANYREEWASYDGELDFQPGLGLLRSSIVMPNSFVETNAYENAASGVPWAMVHDSLAFGLWLSQGMWAKYHVADDSTQLVSYGARPLLLLRNEGTRAQAAPFFGGYQRNVVGFESMTLSLLDSSRITLGPALPLATTLAASPSVSLRIGPSPTSDQVLINWRTQGSTPVRWQLLNVQGRSVRAGNLPHQATSLRLSLAPLPAGVYWFQLQGDDGHPLGQGRIRRE
jgi:cyanophycinase